MRNSVSLRAPCKISHWVTSVIPSHWLPVSTSSHSVSALESPAKESNHTGVSTITMILLVQLAAPGRFPVRIQPDLSPQPADSRLRLDLNEQAQRLFHCGPLRCPATAAHDCLHQAVVNLDVRPHGFNPDVHSMTVCVYRHFSRSKGRRLHCEVDIMGRPASSLSPGPTLSASRPTRCS